MRCSKLILLCASMSKFSTATTTRRSVVWFKSNDLRTQDHAPLFQAHSNRGDGSTVDHIFVLDPRNYRTTQLGNLKCGPRRFEFSFECLTDLDQSFKKHGSCLHVLIGRPETTIPEFMRSISATALYTHSEVAEEELTVQRSVVEACGPLGVKVHESWGGGTLFDPSTLPFDPKKTLSFFTAFRKQVESTNVIATLRPGHAFPPLGSRLLPPATVAAQNSVKLDSTPPALLWDRLIIEGRAETESYSQPGSLGGCSVAPSTPATPPVTEPVIPSSSPDPRGAFTMHGGESEAHNRIQHYIRNGHGRLSVYKETRNGLIGADYSSKLSPYLASGCVTAHQILQAVRDFEKSPGGVSNDSTYWLIFELLWRDYMRFYTMHHGKRLFFLGGVQGSAGRAKWPWGQDYDKFRRWQLGKTGYPIIDAHMRELLHTGFMSNRGRQIVASFLVRDMELDWRLGAEHFECCLVDHDCSSNWGNWQYAAGVGADPREDRYFNIAKQGGDYDPNADHIRLWVPEIKHLPNRILLDVRQLKVEQRAQFGITEDMLPLPVCTLMMDRNPKVFPLPSSGGGGKMSKGGGGRGAKGHQHGRVPGRK